MLVHQLFHSTHKRKATRHYFVDHDGQCILIGGGNGHAAPLFRSHGAGCTANSAARTGSRSTAARYAEVSQEQRWAVGVLAIAAEKKVRRFDVQVNNLV